SDKLANLFCQRQVGRAAENLKSLVLGIGLSPLAAGRYLGRSRSISVSVHCDRSCRGCICIHRQNRVSVPILIFACTHRCLDLPSWLALVNRIANFGSWQRGLKAARIRERLPQAVKPPATRHERKLHYKCNETA